MEIVCRPETYRRFESSSLRQRNTPLAGVFFRWRREEIEEGFEVFGGSCEEAREYEKKFLP